MSFIDLLGYVASITIAVSLLMKSIVRLRTTNMIGSLLYAIYGLYIGSIPVIFMNTVLVLINLYFILKMQQKEYFTVATLAPDSDYIENFLDFYKDDIKMFLPNFNFNPKNDGINFYVLRNMEVAGIFMSRKIAEDAIFIDIDFAIPKYRDFKIRDYIFGKDSSILTSRGITKVYADSGNHIHEKYLKNTGFVETTLESRRVMFKDLKAK